MGVDSLLVIGVLPDKSIRAVIQRKYNGDGSPVGDVGILCSMSHLDGEGIGVASQKALYIAVQYAILKTVVDSKGDRFKGCERGGELHLSLKTVDRLARSAGRQGDHFL